MLVAKWIDTYVIHQWREFRSSYRKLSWLVHEPTTTEFGSEALTDWALRPWVQLTLRANVVQLLQFHLFVLCSRFISLFTLARHDLWFKPNLLLVIMLKAEWIDSYGSHHWRIFRSSYTNFRWVRFEPNTTDFESDVLTDWAIRRWVQLALRTSFVQLSNFLSLLSNHALFLSLSSSGATFALSQVSYW